MDSVCNPWGFAGLPRTAAGSRYRKMRAVGGVGLPLAVRPPESRMTMLVAWQQSSTDAPSPPAASG